MRVSIYGPGHKVQEGCNLYHKAAQGSCWGILSFMDITWGTALELLLSPEGSSNLHSTHTRIPDFDMPALADWMDSTRGPHRVLSHGLGYLTPATHVEACHGNSEPRPQGKSWTRSQISYSFCCLMISFWLRPTKIPV